MIIPINKNFKPQLQIKYFPDRLSSIDLLLKMGLKKSLYGDRLMEASASKRI